MTWKSINKPSEILNREDAMKDVLYRVGMGFSEVTITRVENAHGSLRGWIVNNKREKLNSVD